MTIVIAICILLVIFYVLSILTEEFFIPAIDRIAHRMRLSSEAAGATLLAAGSSAPEFFTSLVAILGLAHGNHADLGAGTIVGSAIFNVLVIIGAASIFKSVTLQWKPVLRDMGMYVITIVLLYLAFADSKITPIEAIVFVAFYALYVFIVVNWKKWLKYDNQELKHTEIPQKSKSLHAFVHRCVGFVVPSPDGKKSYIWAFINSILLIAAMSWLLVEQVIVLADALSINSTFLALTVLAAGTSIPDLIGSVVVARQGRGDMAVSNAVGSNIFDILFGLGLPWLLYGLINGGDALVVSSENLLASILLLLATVVAILFLLIVRDWKIGHKSGFILISLYIAYVIYIAIRVA